MSFFNHFSFLQLIFNWCLLLELSNAGCIEGTDFRCWYGDSKARDDICPSEGFRDYYTTEFISGFPIAGTCFCCRKIHVSSSTKAPDDVLFQGIVTNITSFYRKREEKLIEKSLDIVPTAFNSTQDNYNFSFTVTGVDVKYIDITDFSWRLQLTSCIMQRGLTLHQKLWESTWVNEAEFWGAFLDNHCNQNGHLSEKRIINSTTTFNLKKNIRNLTKGVGYIDAGRYYVKDIFNYTIQLNITGKWRDNLTDAKKEDLRVRLPSGFTFVRNLDDVTIEANALARMESQLPISTVYQSVYESMGLSIAQEQVGIS